MKKILFALLVGFISTLATTNAVNAQTPEILASAQTKTTGFSSKGNTNTYEKNHPLTSETVNAKALKSFKKYFKASDEKWAETKKGFAATFTSDGKINVIYYDEKGRWAGTLKIYYEDKLAKDIRQMVKREYYDYQITVVDEVETNAASINPTYIITIQNATDIKLIRINDYEMDVYKEFKRS